MGGISAVIITEMAQKESTPTTVDLVIYSPELSDWQ